MPDTSFQPDWFSKPGDTLLSLMEQRELTTETLARKLGCAESVVCGLLAGTTAIDSTLASALAAHVGGTPKFWKTRQSKYEGALSHAAHSINTDVGSSWIKNFPHSEMARHGWIRPTRSKDDLIKAYLAYFGVSNPAEWEQRYADFLKQTAFRTSPSFSSKAGPLSAWLRQGEIKATQTVCGPWNPKGLRGVLPEMRILTKAKNPAYFLPRLSKLCAEAGVAIVFTRAPSGCTASGATRFVSPKKAMIILSFRHLSDDHFWFTFFHEIGHLLLHKADLTFIDGERMPSDKAEREADEFSEKILIPPTRREQLLDLTPRRDAIVRFAYSVGVSAGVVVGQLQHHRVIGQHQMNYLKRRFNWEEIEAATSSL